MKKIVRKTIKLSSFAIVFMLLSFQCASASEITEDGILELVNKSRKSIGLNILVENRNLSKAASDKADDMINNNYFAHTSPSNITPWYWIEESGYDYEIAGENLAINFNGVEEQHRAWMESPDHRKNILNSNFQEIGMAVRKGAINGRESLVAVQMFGSRNDFKSYEVESNIDKNKLENIFKKEEKEKSDFSGIVLNFGGGGGNSLFASNNKLPFSESIIFNTILTASLAIILIIVVVNPIIVLSFTVMSFIKEEENDIYIKVFSEKP